QRDEEPSKGRRSDRDDGLPVHAGERSKVSTARAENGSDPAPLIGTLADFSFNGDGNDGLVDFFLDPNFACRLAGAMPFSDLVQHLTHALWADGNILASICAVAGDAEKRRPFMGKIVDQRLFGQTA